MAKKQKKRYILAFDPKVKKRVPFVVIGDKATSTVTGKKFTLKKAR